MGYVLLSKSVLSYVQIHFRTILLVNLVVDLLVESRHSLETVLTSVDNNASFSFLFISEGYLFLFSP